MATKTKNKGLHKDGSRSKEDFSSKKDGIAKDGSVGATSPVSMNGDIDDEPQLWIHTPEEAVSLEEKDRKRISHNVLERRRKDKIKRWVSTIRDLIPKINSGTEKPSHGEVMEKACSYIKELQAKNEKLLQDRGSEVQAEEIQVLKKELSEVVKERDKLLEIIRNAGLSTLVDPTHQWKYRNQSKPDSTATSMDCEPSCSTGPAGDTFVPDISSSSQKDEDAKSKAKRKNTVGFQLEQSKLQQQQLQEAAAAQAMAGAMFGQGFMGSGGMMMNPMIQGLSQQVLNQNLLMNSGFANPGTVVINGNQMIMPMSSAGGGPGVQPGMTANGLGLLQLAMQDAGIGPAQSDSSRQPSPSCSSSSEAMPQSKPVSSSSGSDTPNSVSNSVEDLNSTSALQTLASVASNTQNASIGSVISGVPPPQNPVVSQTSVSVTSTTSSGMGSVMSLGQQPNFSPMVQQGNMVMNMPMVNGGQPGAPGLVQNNLAGYGMGNFMINSNGQMIMVNDQGMPVLTGMPNVQQNEQISVQVTKAEKLKSSKKSKANNSTSSSASVVIPSAQEQIDSGAVNISLVSSKSDMTVINSANTITVTASQTQPSVMPPNMTQQQHPMTLFAQQNLLQQNGLQSLGLPGQPQVSMPSAQNLYPQQQLGGQLAVNQQLLPQQNPGIAMPVSQNGNLLTLNTMPSQPNQLPTALILPNGQIIPVVTNAQTVNSQQPAVSGNLQILPNAGNPQIQYAPQVQQIQRTSMPNTVLTGLDPNSGTQMIIGPGGVQQQIQAPQQQLFQQQLQLQQQLQQQQLQQSNMGLLLTTTASSQVLPAVSTTNCATLNTSVVPTSSTQSVMSTHVQVTGTATNVVQTANSMSNAQESSSTTLLSGQEMDSQPKIQIQPEGMKPIAPSVGQIQSAVTAAGVGGTPGLVQTPGSSPILLTVPVNGQPTNVLVDPVTMQVLATLPTTQAAPVVPTTSATQTTAPISVAPSGGSKKGSKKNQRTLCPKPLSKNTPQSLPQPVVPPPSASPAPIPVTTATTSQTTTSVTSTTFSEPKNNVPTSDASSTSVSAVGTDILAKAAESIFSHSPSEISPMASFYNPANEDNPLHIDTSVGDGEEETGTVSPVKASHDVPAPKKDGGMPPPAVQPAAKVKVPESAPVAQAPIQAPAPISTPALTPASTATPAVSTKVSTPIPAEVTATPTKKSKSKSKSKNKDSTSPESAKSEGKKSSSKKKKPNSAPTPDLEPKVVNLPDTIEFNASQLSDVLDQVENFSATVEPVKKKSRKGKSDSDGHEPPANKKRKKNSSKEKEVPSTPVPQNQTNKALSIYDFQDDSPPEASPSRRNLPSLHPPSTPVSIPPSTPPVPPITKAVSPPVPKEANTAAENFDLLDTVLSQALPLQTSESSSTPNSESVKSPFTSPGDVASKLEVTLSQDPCVPSFPSPVTSTPQVEESVQNSKLENQIQSKPSPITASSSDDTKANVTPIMTPKSDLMENAVSSSMLSPPSAGSSAQGQMSDMVVAAISSSGVDPLAELTASPSASPSPGALIMGSPTYSSMEQTPSQQHTPQWQSPPSMEQSPSQSVQVSRPPSHPPQPLPPVPPPLQQAQPNQTQPRQTQLHQPNPQSNTSMPQPSNTSLPQPSNASMPQPSNASIAQPSNASIAQPSNASMPQQPNASMPQQTNSSMPQQTNSSMPQQTNASLPQQPNASLPQQPNASMPQPTNASMQLQSTNSMPQQTSNTMPRQSNSSMPQQSNTSMSSNSSMPQQQNMTMNKTSNVQPQLSCSSQKSMQQQSPSSTTMVSPPAPRLRGNQDGQSFSKGHGQVSSYQRSPCQDILGPDQIFSSSSQVSSAPKLTHPPTSSHMNKPVNSESSASQRSRNSIYSADNFVQPSRSSDSRSSMSSNVPNSGNGFGRMQTDASNESFNFTSIGLNLTSSTTTNSLPESLTNSSNSATPFSFSLTPVTSTTVTTTASSSAAPMPPNPTPQIPFYTLQTPVSQQPSSHSGGSSSNSQGGQSMLPLGMNLRFDGSGPPSRHPPNNVQGQGPFNFGLMDMNSRTIMPTERLNMHDKGHGNFGGNVSAPKRHANIPASRQMQGSQPVDHNTSTSQRSPHVNNSSAYYPPPNFQTSASLHTAPLHHPPAQSGESARLAHPRTPYDSPFPGPGQPMGAMSFPNRYDPGHSPFNRACNPPQPFDHSSNQNSESRKSTNQSSKANKQPQQTPPLSHPQSQSQNPISASQQSHTATNSHNSSCSSQPNQPAQLPQPVSQVRSQKRKQSKKASKQQQQQPNYNCDMESTNLSHSIFEGNQGIASYFQIPNLPPSPSRNMSNEGPSFLAGNIFGAGGRPISNSGPGMHKNAELGPPFNSLFPPARAQNGLGLNFQHTFGMNPGNPSNPAQLGSHSGGVSLTPHMPNFSLGNLNFLSDVNGGGQNDSLNISPIKFHGNSILPPQPGMDPNSLQHPHQGSSLYHQRGQPPQPHVIHNTMSINSILGQHPHSFDVRPMGQPMNSSVTPPFHGAGHPGSFSMPPLNFAMHGEH